MKDKWEIYHNLQQSGMVTIRDTNGNVVSAVKETLDLIFGTEEEISNEPKATLNFRIIDMGDIRKDEEDSNRSS